MSGPARTELEQAALAGLAEKAESWQPVKEAAHPRSIVGKVVRIEAVERTTSYSPQPVVVPIVTLVGSDGVGWNVWLWQTVLASEMRRVRPQVGDVLAVEYLGQVQPQAGGTPYHSYRIAKADDGSEPEPFDWQAAGPPPEPEQVVHGAPAAPPPAAAQPQTPAAPAAPEPDDDIPF